jgi:hypothetical protein
MKKPYLWVVEIKDDEQFKEWTPCEDGFLTKREAQEGMCLFWKRNNRNDKFRVVKYERGQR